MQQQTLSTNSSKKHSDVSSLLLMTLRKEGVCKVDPNFSLPEYMEQKYMAVKIDLLISLLVQ